MASFGFVFSISFTFIFHLSHHGAGIYEKSQMASFCKIALVGSGILPPGPLSATAPIRVNS
jgi:hypothetical protein